jgi:tetratricopeptide (TPR) repeat protein
VERVLNGTWEPGKDKPAESRKSVIAREVRAKVKSGDFDGAYDLLDREAAAEPGLAGYTARLKFRTAYFDRQDWGTARAFAEGMLEGPAGKDAESLGDVAEWMINEGAPPVREYSVATKLATRAVELTGAKDGSILDILARCNFHLGDLERAVELQTKAVNLMLEGQAKANMAETLRLMRERQEEKHKVEQK